MANTVLTCALICVLFMQVKGATFPHYEGKINLRGQSGIGAKSSGTAGSKLSGSITDFEKENEKNVQNIQKNLEALRKNVEAAENFGSWNEQASGTSRGGDKSQTQGHSTASENLTKGNNDLYQEIWENYSRRLANGDFSSGFQYGQNSGSGSDNKNGSGSGGAVSSSSSFSSSVNGEGPKHAYNSHSSSTPNSNAYSYSFSDSADGRK